MGGTTLAPGEGGLVGPMLGAAAAQGKRETQLLSEEKRRERDTVT